MKIKTRLVLILAGLISVSFAFKKGLEIQLELNHFKNILPEKVYFMNYEISRLSKLRLGEIDPSKLSAIASDYLNLVNGREKLYNTYPEIKKAVDYIETHPTNSELASVAGVGFGGCIPIAYGLLGLTDEIRKRKKK